MRWNWHVTRSWRHHPHIARVWLRRNWVCHRCPESRRHWDWMLLALLIVLGFLRLSFLRRYDPVIRGLEWDGLRVWERIAIWHVVGEHWRSWVRSMGAWWSPRRRVLHLAVHFLP